MVLANELCLSYDNKKDIIHNAKFKIKKLLLNRQNIGDQAEWSEENFQLKKMSCQ